MKRANDIIELFQKSEALKPVDLTMQELFSLHPYRKGKKANSRTLSNVKKKISKRSRVYY